MNTFQKFIADHPGGFLKDTDMPALIAMHRLCPVVVRCGNCRFVAGAQDVPHLIKCIRAGGDYVRDVSITYDAQQNSAAWHYEPTCDARPAQQRPESWSLNRPKLKTAANLRAQDYQEGRDWICTGNFDGNTCGTDADSGL